MKKIFYSLFILATVLIAGCSNDSATIRTQLEKDGATVHDVRVSDNTATAKATYRGKNITIYLKKVNGKWIGDWNKHIGSMKKNINKQMGNMLKRVNHATTMPTSSNQSKIARKLKSTNTIFDKIKQKHTDNVEKLRQLNYSLNLTLETHLPTSRKVSEIKSTITKQKNEALKSLKKLKKLMIMQIAINKTKKIVMEGQIKTLQNKKQKLLQELRPNAPDVVEVIEKINQIKYDIAKLAKVREIHTYISDSYSSDAKDMHYGSTDDLYGTTSDAVIFCADLWGRYHREFDIMTASPQGGYSKSKIPKNSILASSYQIRKNVCFIQLEGLVIARTDSHNQVRLATNNVSRTLDYYFISSVKCSGNYTLPIAFSPDGKYLLCRARYSGRVHTIILLYEVKNGKLICVFQVPPNTLKAIFWNGEYLIMGGALWYIKDLISDFDPAFAAKLVEARRQKLIAEKPLKDYNNYMKQASRKRGIQAIELYKKALKIDLSKENNGTALIAQAYYKIAYCYMRKRSPKLALGQYSKVLELYPETQAQALVVAQAHNDIGSIYYKYKQYEQALTHYKKAYKVYQEKLGANTFKSRKCLSKISRVQKKIDREAKRQSKKNRRR